MCGAAFTYGLTCWADFPSSYLPADMASTDEDGNVVNTDAAQSAVCKYVRHAANSEYPELDEVHYEANDVFSTAKSSTATTSQKVALGLFVPLTVLFSASSFFYSEKLKNGGNNGKVSWALSAWEPRF